MLLTAEVLLANLVMYCPRAIDGGGVTEKMMEVFCGRIKQELLNLKEVDSVFTESDKNSLHQVAYNNPLRYGFFVGHYYPRRSIDLEMVNAGLPQYVVDALKIVAKGIEP